MMVSSAIGVLGAGPAKRIDLPHGTAWLVQPAGLVAGDPAPLIITLHGSTQTAADMLALWSAVPTDVPCVFAAPQAHGTGWEEADLPLIHDLLDYLAEHVPHDRERILLVGHSAGGAMALHLLFKDEVPATAAAVTATLVPRTITPEDVVAHREVPVFCAIGRQDPGRDRMREGVLWLRQHGAVVTLERPHVAHELDRTVAAQAIRWFESYNAARWDARLKEMAGALKPGTHSTAVLELLLHITEHPRFHAGPYFTRASETLDEMLRSAQEALAKARRLVDRGEQVRAYDEALTVEQRYPETEPGRAARRLREELAQRPEVAKKLRHRRREEGERRAAVLALAAERAEEREDWSEASRQAELALTLYPNTAGARRAKKVLDRIPSSFLEP